MIKYGVQMLLFTDSFTEDKMHLVRKAKELGFDGVEVLISDPKSFPVEALRTALKEQCMGVNFAAALGPETNSISPDAAERAAAIDFLKKCTDVAYEITGGGCVLGGPNYAAWCYLTGRSPTKQEWQWAVDNYRKVCEYAARKNITMSVEVLNRFETHLFNTIEAACLFCSEVGLENAKVQPDTYHMNMEEKSWGKPIRNAAERIGYIHVIESDRGVVGTGLVDWQEFFSALSDIGYDGWLTVEAFTRDSEGLAGLTKIWRDPAESAEALASESLKALREYEQQHFGPKATRRKA
jgi:D-psicose/D-tagatose/L-ribulose 3-epimerase